MRQLNLIFIALLTGFVSCTTIEDCQNDKNQEYIVIGFSHSSTVRFDSITVDQAVRFAGDDSARVSFAPFLDPTVTQTTYTFYTDSIDYDLTLSYQAQLQIYELDCEPSLQFSSVDTLSTSFDSLVIVNRNLSLSNASPDVQVFF